MYQFKQNKKNAKEVQREFRRYMVHFMVLIVLAGATIYMFLASASSQRKNIKKDVVAYKEILNKHKYLYDKLDSIHYHMSLLNTGKVQNDIFLSNCHIQTRFHYLLYAPDFIRSLVE